MKNTLILALTIGLLTIIMYSCQKNYTCTCVTTVNDTIENTVKDTLHGTQKSVNSTCSAKDYKIHSGSITEITTCTATLNLK